MGLTGGLSDGDRLDGGRDRGTLIASARRNDPEEEEDDRVAERRERLLRGDDAEDDREGRPEDGGHGERDGLRDPPEKDPGDDREEARRTLPEHRRGKGEEQCESGRAEEETGGSPAPLEAFLHLGEATLRGGGRGRKGGAPAPVAEA